MVKKVVVFMTLEARPMLTGLCLLLGSAFLKIDTA